MTYFKAILALVGAVATAVGGVYATGHANLAAILIAVGGAIATGGGVAAASNKPDAVEAQADHAAF